jgi:hypothetical protein
LRQCETRLLEGSVRTNTPDHDVAAGHCLLCVGQPATAAGAGGLMPLKARLMQREVLPFVASFALLAVAACARRPAALARPAVDRPLARHSRHAAHHRLHRLLAAQAQAHPQRSPGAAAALARGLAWLGSLLVLVHAGVHFNAILGWLAVWAMLINVGSGLTGKFLLDRARRRLEEARQRMRARGLPKPNSRTSSTGTA